MRSAMPQQTLSQNRMKPLNVRLLNVQYSRDSVFKGSLFVTDFDVIIGEKIIFEKDEAWDYLPQEFYDNIVDAAKSIAMLEIIQQDQPDDAVTVRRYA